MKQLIAPLIGADTEILTNPQTGDDEEKFVMNPGRVTANITLLAVGVVIGAFVL